MLSERERESSRERENRSSRTYIFDECFEYNICYIISHPLKFLYGLLQARISKQAMNIFVYVLEITFSYIRCCVATTKSVNKLLISAQSAEVNKFLIEGYLVLLVWCKNSLYMNSFIHYIDYKSFWLLFETFTYFWILYLKFKYYLVHTVYIGVIVSVISRIFKLLKE